MSSARPYIRVSWTVWYRGPGRFSSRWHWYLLISPTTYAHGSGVCFVFQLLYSTEHSVWYQQPLRLSSLPLCYSLWSFRCLLIVSLSWKSTWRLRNFVSLSSWIMPRMRYVRLHEVLRLCRYTGYDFLRWNINRLIAEVGNQTPKWFIRFGVGYSGCSWTYNFCVKRLMRIYEYRSTSFGCHFDPSLGCEFEKNSFFRIYFCRCSLFSRVELLFFREQDCCIWFRRFSDDGDGRAVIHFDDCYFWFYGIHMDVTKITIKYGRWLLASLERWRSLYLFRFEKSSIVPEMRPVIPLAFLTFGTLFRFFMFLLIASRCSWSLIKLEPAPVSRVKTKRFVVRTACPLLAYSL